MSKYEVSNQDLFKSYLDKALAKKVDSKRRTAYDSRGLDSKKNYSSFWMDNQWDASDKFSGLGSTKSAGSNDLIKSIKLSNYRRAITNFVKILTKREIPVKFHGTDSYTDNNSITISSDIKDNNFDVTVGLALHEASHCVLTNFDLLKDFYNNPHVVRICGKHVGFYRAIEISDMIKQMLNFVEDRRIDNYVFTTSPGYKAYYHKLYDHYWNSAEIANLFVSNQHNTPELDNYWFHIINMMNPLYNAQALPGLQEITDLVDLKNISRLDSTESALEIAANIVDIVLTNVEANPPQQQDQDGEGSEDLGDNEGEQDTNGQSPMGGDSGDNTQGDAPGMQAEGEGEESSDSMRDLEAKESNKLNEALNRQREFLAGNTGKKVASKALEQRLRQVQNAQMEVQAVGGDDEGVKSQSCLMVDLTGNEIHQIVAESQRLSELQDKDNLTTAEREEKDALRYGSTSINARYGAILDFLQFSSYRGLNTTYYAEPIQQGLEMGALLGKKLQLHNESRVRVDNRLRSGKIDNRRLAHAGYGIENVFHQITVDSYKNANLHISLDGSGSMGGNKWTNTIKMTLAIAKAASYTQGINIQVSIRVTTYKDVAANLFIYDSRKNKINHLVTVLQAFSPNSMTPEGLCFEAMCKQNLLVSGTAGLDSYFLNISDGAPGTNNYGGRGAQMHTRKWVQKMRSQYEMQILSFWIENPQYYGGGSDFTLESLQNAFNSSNAGQMFRNMYGRDASVVDPSSAVGIARELNKKFMSSKA